MSDNTQWSVPLLRSTSSSELFASHAIVINDQQAFCYTSELLLPIPSFSFFRHINDRLFRYVKGLHQLTEEKKYVSYSDTLDCWERLNDSVLCHWTTATWSIPRLFIFRFLYKARNSARFSLFLLLASCITALILFRLCLFNCNGSRNHRETFGSSIESSELLFWLMTFFRITVIV